MVDRSALDTMPTNITTEQQQQLPCLESRMERNDDDGSSPHRTRRSRRRRRRQRRQEQRRRRCIYCYPLTASLAVLLSSSLSPSTTSSIHNNDRRWLWDHLDSSPSLLLVSALGYPKTPQRSTRYTSIVDRGISSNRGQPTAIHSYHPRRHKMGVTSSSSMISCSFFLVPTTTSQPCYAYTHSQFQISTSVLPFCSRTQLSASSSSSSSSSSDQSESSSSSSSSSYPSSPDDDDDGNVTNVNEQPLPPVFDGVQDQSQLGNNNDHDHGGKKNENSSSSNNNNDDNNNNNNNMLSLSVQKLDRRLARLESKYVTRISRLEEIVSRQEMEMHKLRKTCSELQEVSEAFAQLIKLLRESGLDTDTTGGTGAGSSTDDPSSLSSSGTTSTLPPSSSSSSSSSNGSAAGQQSSSPSSDRQQRNTNNNNSRVIESFDDAMIFGRAPSSVIDAADAAGTAILAGMLGGKQRMLVDVRDAELSNDPETLVQFIELAILPVAAGLEGLKSTRNRVKIVFPKVSQLLEYRRTMALAAPEVVALSTLDFDPIEERDKLVVIVAPEPDDDEGMAALKAILAPVGSAGMIIKQPIQQPLVLLNYHMHPPPVYGLETFETAYHLRLLAVQYVSASAAEQYMEQIQAETDGKEDAEDDSTVDPELPSDILSTNEGTDQDIDDDDDELESAVKHAHDVGVNHGTTRAMVIRAYPRPWHVFVDISPDTDADYEVAATFDEEPTAEELNMAIVECLEGSEREDELVAQQMQQALEDGQLDKVSERISEVLNAEENEEEDDEADDDIDSDDDDDNFDVFEEDSV